MSERKGLFTSEQEEFLADVLDDFFKLKNPVFEQFDKLVFKNLIRIGDDTGLDQIDPVWKVKLVPIVDSAMLGNVEDVRKYTTDLLNEKIDIPKIDEEQELMVFDALTKFIAAAVDYYIQKKLNKVE
jgi:hypothetical protein